MKVWLVNPFDPLPGDPEQEGRYGSLVRHLAAAGHETTWWTSSFSHRFKRPVDQTQIMTACREIGVDARFLPSSPYYENVRARRLWNHWQLARQFTAAAAKEEAAPEVLVASAPPCLLANRAVRFVHNSGTKVIVDVQDLWPETFRRAVPKPLRGVFGALLWPWQRQVQRAYQEADAIVGVADEYVERAMHASGDKRLRATIPLGLDLSVFDAAAEEGRCDQFTKPAREVWLAYTGSLNRSYDCLTLLHAAAVVREKLGPGFGWRLFVSGRGELSDEACRIVLDSKLDNVTLTGFMDFPQWAYLLSQCDVGFNAAFPEAMICLPNKLFYYFAAGVAVANTIAGQCSRIVQEGKCGVDYSPGDVEGCAAVMERMITNRDATSDMGRSARRLAQETYDRDLLMPRYVDFIQQVACL